MKIQIWSEKEKEDKTTMPQPTVPKSPLVITISLRSTEPANSIRNPSSAPHSRRRIEQIPRVILLLDRRQLSLVPPIKCIQRVRPTPRRQRYQTRIVFYSSFPSNELLFLCPQDIE